MKQNFHQSKQKGSMVQKYKKFPYELTIGMIIKNDIERLQKCLESMQPLRDAIPCQLIITDTGSTDGARELAGKYADILMDFPWCDDFSKARNTGVEKAEGRWFVFIDSDFEFDESISAVVDFLKSKASYQADCAYATIRNYTGSMENLGYMDITKALFFNFGEKRRYFEGRIHESIIAYIDTAEHIPVLIQHWGYMDEFTVDKKNRNLNLLLAGMEENPLEMKNYLQITAELDGKPAECKPYVLKGIEAAKKNIALGNVDQLEEGMLVNLQLQVAKLGDKLKDKDLKAQGMAEAKGKYPGTVLELEYLGLHLADLWKTEEVEETLATFLKLKNLYLALQKKPDIYYINTGHFYAMDSNYYHIQEYHTLVYGLNQKERHLFEPVIEGAFAYEFQNLQGQHTYLTRYLELAKQLQSSTLLYKLYRRIQSHGTEQEKKEVMTVLGTCFSQFVKGEYRALLETFSQEKPNEFLAPYLWEASTVEGEALPHGIATYFHERKQSYTIHDKVLFMDYMKTGKDTFGYMKTVSYSVVEKQFDQYWKQYPQPQALVYEMFQRPSSSFSSWKEKKFCGMIGLRALHLLCQGDSRDTAQMKHLYQGASQLLGAYVQGVYQPSMLSNEEDLIPQVELFAYHSHKAWEAEEDDRGFLLGMKGALLACKDYKNIVTYFIALRNEKSPMAVGTPSGVEGEKGTSHSSAMEKKVKKTVGDYILSGKKEKARRILDKYKKVNPQDPDLPLLERSLLS